MEWNARRLRHGAIGLVFAAMAAIGSCECDDDLVEIPEPTCEPDKQCKVNQAYRYGKCVSTYCEADEECCPGTYCSLASNACLPNNVKLEFECRSNLDCFERFQDPGLHCALEPGAEEGVCLYDACNDSDDCPFGRSCFKGWCVSVAPCGGACPQGQVCEVGSSTCHPVPEQKGCGKVCEPGKLLVVTNPDVMTGDSCCPIECGCALLPSLQPGVFGRFASMGLGVNEVLVSAYDESYGDLVVARYSPDGDFRGMDYVDGIPVGGTLGGDPAGPRGGIVTPGPDVGQYTSLVVNSVGEPRVAYYDVDNGDLRVAIFSLASRGWATHVVDDDREAGRYAAITMDPDTEQLRIAYMVSGLDTGGHAAAAVRVATSRAPDPQTAQDWDVVTVEQVEVRDPCNDSCNSGAVCVWNGQAPTCFTSSSQCQPECASGQACVQSSDGPVCVAQVPPPLAGLPGGVGLWASMVRTPTDDVLVYYDAIEGNLRGVHVGASGPGTPVVIDGDGIDGRNDGDVGRFASVAYDPNSGEIAIAYEDVTRHRLLYYSGVDLTGGDFEVIEDGSGAPPGVNFIGADAALGFLDNGTAVLVYQDASFMDLAFAQRGPLDPEWRTERLLADGAYGFDTALATTPNVIYAASAAPRLDSRRQLASRLILFLRPL